MININCDIGEREPDNPIDIALMSYIHIANIACGGHAGDDETVTVFRNLAEKHKVDVAAHLSYPDKKNFGRLTVDISSDELLASLDHQYTMMPDIKMIKFHGALYNDCCADAGLATVLGGWLESNGIERIITPEASELAMIANQRGIDVVAEAFAERTYAYDPKTGRLSLTNRQRAYACIHDCDEAIRHSETMMTQGYVAAYIENTDGTTVIEQVDIHAETLCIHSDSEIALELAKRLSALNV